MPITRRDLLRTSAVGAGALAVGNVGSLFAGAVPVAAAPPRGYGELRPDRAGLLDLPPGFRYRVVSEVGDPLVGGGSVADRFDGTGAFPGPDPRRSTYLVRNHEQAGAGNPAVVAPAELTYDAMAAGGTTTLLVDRRGSLMSEAVSLGGTHTNCAGGVTPWGTWLTCEETEAKAGARFTRDHGFVFEVDPADPGNNTSPTPLAAMGRFAHEAVAVDPATKVAYLTEDAGGPNGLLYRFTPSNTGGGYGSYRDGGVLEAMHCFDGGTPVTDLSPYRTIGKRLRVEWVPVPDPLATTTSIRRQLTDDQVTRSRKLEGAWWGDGRAYVVSSFARAGAPPIGDTSLASHDGQVWSFDPATQTLRLEVYLDVNPAPEGAGADIPDGPDNITVSPYGGLFLAEDGRGVQHLLSVSMDGSAHVFARNARDGSEFAGVCFSPDGRTMFANIQSPGATFAIRGPFRRTH